MIDFHTHILPGMDDGSKSVEESIALLQEEARQGADMVFLTSHFYAAENSPSEFLRRRQAARQELSLAGDSSLPPVRLGAEVQYFEGIASASDMEHLKIMGTNLLLLEMPFCRWTDRMVDDAAELGDRLEARIVLAHIERYLPMQAASVWKQLRSQGVLMQCNASFFGNWKTRRKAMSMLSGGEIQFVGTDCHNLHTRRPNWDLLPPKGKTWLSRNEASMGLQNFHTA